MAQIDKFKKENFKKDTKGSIVKPSTSSPIGKYFSIDISNLYKYMKGAPDLGKDYKESIVTVNHDLDVFVEAHVRHFKDGHYTVEFWGDRAELTDKLATFINEYVRLFGPCLNGAEEITKEDYELVDKRRFERLWENTYVSMSNNDDNILVMVLGMNNPPQATVRQLSPEKQDNIKER